MYCGHTTFNTKKQTLILFWGQVEMSFGQVFFIKFLLDLPEWATGQVVIKTYVATWSWSGPSQTLLTSPFLYTLQQGGPQLKILACCMAKNLDIVRECTCAKREDPCGWGPRPAQGPWKLWDCRCSLMLYKPYILNIWPQMSCNPRIKIMKIVTKWSFWHGA